MTNYLAELVGPNWRTTLLGWLSRSIMALVVMSMTNPEAIHKLFGNTPFSNWFTGSAVTIWLLLGGAKDFNTKDKQVAGNNPEVVSEGNVQTKVAK